MSPAGPRPRAGPVVEPDDGCTVHLVGLGRAIIDPRDGALKAVGGACTFGTTVEMLLLEMQVPYVLHALDPDAKAAWYVDMFEKAFTPALYVGGGVWMQETADIVAKVLADHPERAVQTGLSARVQKEGGGVGGGIEEVRVRPSLLPADYTPMSNLLAGWYYCAYEPCDVGSEAYEAMDEAEREADSEYEQQAGRCTSAAFTEGSGYAGGEAGCAGGAPGAPCVLLRRAHGCGRRDALRGAADLVHEPG